MFFEEIPGLNEIKKSLIEGINKGRVPHAQLFFGNEGSSAFQMALAYARYLVCSEKQENESCAHCPTCKQFTSLNFPDLHFSFPMASKGQGAISCEPYMAEWKSFIKANPFFTLDQWSREAGIDKKQLIINVKESERIYNILNLRAYSGTFKILIISHADRLNHQAANKLLKLIEEPQPNTLLLFTSNFPEHIIQTILSRCQKFFIPKHHVDDITSFLIEKASLGKKEASSTAHFSEGSISKALSLAIEHERLSSNAHLFAEWFRACYHAKVKEILTVIDQLSKYSRDGQKAFLIFASQVVRERLSAKYKTEQNPNPIFDEVNFRPEGFTAILHSANASFLLELLNEAIYDISRNGNGRILLLDLSLKLSNALRMKETA